MAAKVERNLAASSLLNSAEQWTATASQKRARPDSTTFCSSGIHPRVTANNSTPNSRKVSPKQICTRAGTLAAIDLNRRIGNRLMALFPSLSGYPFDQRRQPLVVLAAAFHVGGVGQVIEDRQRVHQPPRRRRRQ